MTDWIQTKAGLQMAESLIRTLRVIKQEITALGTIALNTNSSGQTTHLYSISKSLEEIVKDKQIMRSYAKDILKLCDEMDIRKQENINLSHRVKELETMLKGYQPEFKGRCCSNNRLKTLDQKYHTLTEILRDKITRLETIIEERK
jgi:DNA-binding ferritin-like protein